MEGDHFLPNQIGEIQLHCDVWLVGWKEVHAGSVNSCGEGYEMTIIGIEWQLQTSRGQGYRGSQTKEEVVPGGGSYKVVCWLTTEGVRFSCPSMGSNLIDRRQMVVVVGNNNSCGCESGCCLLMESGDSG